MCVFKNHAFIYFLRPPSWSGTVRIERLGDLFIWFGASLHKRFQGPVMCCLVPALKSRLLLAIVMIKQVAIGSYKNQTSLLFPFSLLCGSWKNTVYLKCRHPHSLAQSSYIMSLSYISLPSAEAYPASPPGHLFKGTLTRDILAFFIIFNIKLVFFSVRWWFLDFSFAWLF